MIPSVHFSARAIIWLLPAALCSASQLKAQTPVQTTSQTQTLARGQTSAAPPLANDDKIRDIRAIFQQIEGDSTLHKMSLSKEEFLGDEAVAGGASMTGYFKGDTLCKISTWMGISYAAFQENYYFDHGKLVFVYEVEKDYPEMKNGEGLDYSRLIRAFEGRYFFDGYKAISILTKGTRKMSQDELHHPLELYHNANYYYDLILKKRKGTRGAVAVL
jgi:hypothetical protein